MLESGAVKMWFESWVVWLVSNNNKQWFITLQFNIFRQHLIWNIEHIQERPNMIFNHLSYIKTAVPWTKSQLELRFRKPLSA